MAVGDAPAWVPESCALPTQERPLRAAEFDTLFAESVLRVTRVSVIRLDLVLAGGAEKAARELAAREASCCSFFRFDFDVRGSEITMRIAVPESQSGVLDALTDRVTSIAGGKR